jgi:hypothetical protein
MQLEPHANDGWQEIVHQPVAHRPTLSLPLPHPPLPFIPNVQADRVVLLVQSSHASKRLKPAILEPKLDKGKEVANPSKSSKDSYESISSHLHLKHDFCHVISEIHPQGSNQLKVVAQDKSEKGSRESSSEKRKNASHNKYGYDNKVLLKAIRFKTESYISIACF